MQKTIWDYDPSHILQKFAVSKDLFYLKGIMFSSAYIVVVKSLCLSAS